MSPPEAGAGRPGRTGLPGRPRPPLVVSAAVAGPADRHPSLDPPARAVLGALQDLRGHLRRDGVSLIEGWSLGTMDHRGRQRWSKHPERGVDPTAWNAALAGLPDRYELVQLDPHLLWGGLRAAAPSRFFIAPVRDVTVWATVPTEAHAAAIATSLLEVVRDAVAAPGFTTGFVHVDSIADPYGTVVCPVGRLSEGHLDVEVHGYYWAVALGPGHLDRLGGVASLAAPGRIVEETLVGGEEGVLCRVTEHPEAMDEATVSRWRETLRPVLRAGFPTGREKVGRTGADLARPVWLFEGEPAPRLVEGALSGVGERSPVPLALGPAVGAGSVRARLEMAADATPDGWLGAVSAVVGAWAALARPGRLLRVNGAISHVGEVAVDGPALVWDVDMGTCEAEAWSRLAGALGLLAGDEPTNPFVRLEVG